MDDEGLNTGEKASAEADRMHAAIRTRLLNDTIVFRFLLNRILPVLNLFLRILESHYGNTLLVFIV